MALGKTRTEDQQRLCRDLYQAVCDHNSTEERRIELAREAVRQGIDLNEPLVGDPPVLLLALSERRHIREDDNAKLVNVLVHELKLNPNVADSSGLPVLNYAMQHQHPERLEELEMLLAAPGIKINHKHFGRTALHVAAGGENHAAVERLIAAGADANLAADGKDGHAIAIAISSLEQCKYMPSTKPENIRNAMKQRVAILKLLVGASKKYATDNDAALDALQDMQSWLGLLNNKLNDTERMIHSREFIKGHLEPTVDALRSSFKQYTALMDEHEAQSYGAPGTSATPPVALIGPVAVTTQVTRPELTLEKQSELNNELFAIIRDRFHSFNENSRIEKVQELLKVGADVNAIDALGMTPLMHCAQGLRNFNTGETPILMDVLLGVPGVNINAADRMGYTALHHVLHARPRSRGYSFKKLYDAGADTHLADLEGATPLHHAAELCLNKELRILASHGALHTPNEDGKTPLMLAIDAIAHARTHGNESFNDIASALKSMSYGLTTIAEEIDSRVKRFNYDLSPAVKAAHELRPAAELFQSTCMGAQNVHERAFVEQFDRQIKKLSELAREMQHFEKDLPDIDMPHAARTMKRIADERKGEERIKSVERALTHPPGTHAQRVTKPDDYIPPQRGNLR